MLVPADEEAEAAPSAAAASRPGGAAPPPPFTGTARPPFAADWRCASAANTSVSSSHSVLIRSFDVRHWRLQYDQMIAVPSFDPETNLKEFCKRNPYARFENTA